MLQYVIQRLALVVVVLVAVSMLVFAITAILPGSVAHLILGPFAAPEQVKALELKLGLADPLWLQYWRWASRLLVGDFGRSLLMDRPVSPLIAEAFTRSLTLAFTSFVLIALIGVGPVSYTHLTLPTTPYV